MPEKDETMSMGCRGIDERLLVPGPKRWYAEEGVERTSALYTAAGEKLADASRHARV